MQKLQIDEIWSFSMLEALTLSLFIVMRSKMNKLISFYVFIIAYSFGKGKYRKVYVPYNCN